MTNNCCETLSPDKTISIDEIAQLEQVPAAQSDELDSIPGTPRVETEN